MSRSFYLTLRILPPPVRDQVALAYLFARAADTVADTDLIDQPRRLELLRLLKSQFEHAPFRPEEIRTIREALLAYQTLSSERVLLERLEDCFQVYGEFSNEDRQRKIGNLEVLDPNRYWEARRLPRMSSAWGRPEN